MRRRGRLSFFCFQNSVPLSLPSGTGPSRNAGQTHTEGPKSFTSVFAHTQRTWITKFWISCCLGQVWTWAGSEPGPQGTIPHCWQEQGMRRRRRLGRCWQSVQAAFYKPYPTFFKAHYLLSFFSLYWFILLVTVLLYHLVVLFLSFNVVKRSLAMM